MTEVQAEVLIGTVTEMTHQIAHLSDQLDLIHQTTAVQTDYLIWTFGLVALLLSFLAFIAGFILAKGR